jgi:hypothetical protein
MMQLNELAELFDVSTKKLLRTLAAARIERKWERKKQDKPTNDVLSFEDKKTQQRPEDETSQFKKNLHGFREKIELSKTLKEKLESLADRGKIGLGILTVISGLQASSDKQKKIKSLLWDLGNETFNNSVETIRRKVMKKSDTFQSRLNVLNGDADESTIPNPLSSYAALVKRGIKNLSEYALKNRGLENKNTKNDQNTVAES